MTVSSSWVGPTIEVERKTSRLDLAVIAAVSILFSAWWSAHKLLTQDEMFSYQTDTVRSLAEVVRIQRHYPISLDPLVYHTLAHLCVSLFGATAFAMRLPSMLGYALMLCCIYVFSFRAACSRWPAQAARRIAQFAAVLPMLTATFLYATEGRPYGLLLGLTALAFTCWQAATRAPHARRWSLPLLAFSLALALNTHYFAVLILPPLYLAEAVRTFERRRLDAPLTTALLLGTAGIVGTLPFQPAVRAFSTHYYSAGVINQHAITQAYRSLLVDYTTTSLQTQRLLAALFVVVALLFLVALFLRRHQLALPPAEATLLVAVSALPLFGFLLARFVTHSYEVRYVLEAVFGLAVLLALLLAPLLASDSPRRGALRWLAFALVPAVALLHIRAEKEKTAATLASLRIPETLRTALFPDPDHHLYIQQMGHYELTQFYQPDPVIRANTVLVYDAPREVRFSGHDTEALTAEHMQHFTALPIVPYSQLQQSPAPQVWLLYNDGWDFAHMSLPQDHATITHIAPLFGGTAARVTFSGKP